MVKTTFNAPHGFSPAENKAFTKEAVNLIRTGGLTDGAFSLKLVLGAVGMDLVDAQSFPLHSDIERIVKSAAKKRSKWHPSQAARSEKMYVMELINGLPTMESFLKVLRAAQEPPKREPRVVRSFKTYHTGLREAAQRVAWEEAVKKHIIKNCLSEEDRNILGRLQGGARGTLERKALVFWKNLGRWAEKNPALADRRVVITPISVPAQAAA